MIPKYRAWHHELGRMMPIETMYFFANELEELQLNDSVMNDSIPASPEEIELMQFTGLFDKNGNEIFEGDIVEFEDEVWYTDGGFYENKDEAYDSVQTNNRVVIIYDGFEWDLDNFWKGTSDCSSAWMSIFEDHMQSLKYFLQNEASVIGNIYENPELLEVTE